MSQQIKKYIKIGHDPYCTTNHAFYLKVAAVIRPWPLVSVMCSCVDKITSTPYIFAYCSIRSAMWASKSGWQIDRSMSWTRSSAFRSFNTLINFVTSKCVLTAITIALVKTNKFNSTRQRYFEIFSLEDSIIDIKPKIL